jgi:predicted nucleic acid-binding protein
MTVGVDSSIIVAAVHANHPLHKPMAGWLDAAFDEHSVVIAHHTVLGSYAVLTRLPAPYRLGPAEADRVLRETLETHATIAPFDGAAIWDLVDRIGQMPAAGGATYDAFIIEILKVAGVLAIATSKVDQFRRLSRDIDIIDPLA